MAAGRDTLQEANELKAQFESRYPTLNFKVTEIDASWFIIREARHCNCGAEILTAAIGEFDLDECNECQTKRESRQASESKARAAQSSESVRRHAAFDEYSERGY